ncbi:MAG: hypothetical protein ABS46_00860 [Cytophagaceae bacterium SCN 52-12]|nr:MAG: hypothetical protein ABS46_00860 [Cytophagaceae bacterium SCN 52-12]
MQRIKKTLQAEKDFSTKKLIHIVRGSFHENLKNIQELISAMNLLIGISRKADISIKCYPELYRRKKG